MKPSIGRIVHYRLPNKYEDVERWRPAIVTAVWSDNCVNLRLFLDGANDADALPIYGTDPAHPDWITSSTAGADVGDWRWPPRV